MNIIDTRTAAEFKQVSFSGYKRTDAKKQFAMNLLTSNIEQCCYWSAELICAGHLDDVWETLIDFYTKHIHIGTPKMAIYLHSKMDKFDTIIKQTYEGHASFTVLRNDEGIRQLFCEIICVFCDAQRAHSIKEIKLDATHFTSTMIEAKIQAPHTTLGEQIYHYGEEDIEDPEELFIAINELAFHLTTQNMYECCYWLEWILEYDAICKKKKLKLAGKRRLYCIDPKHQHDVCWLVWETILTISRTHVSHYDILQSILESIVHIFAFEFCAGTAKKRKSLWYFALQLLTNPSVNLQIPLFRDTHKIKTVVYNISTIYQQIKENEHSGKMKYLFMDEHLQDV